MWMFMTSFDGGWSKNRGELLTALGLALLLHIGLILLPP